MNRKTLILSVGIVIVALLSVSFAAVMAEPVSKTAGTQAQDIKKILGIVKNTQAHVVVVENQVSAPHPSPVRYEYYTEAMMGDGHSNVYAMAMLLNTGDTAADVHWEMWWKPSGSDFVLYGSHDVTVDPGDWEGCTPTVVALPNVWFYYKITTPSKYVIPTASLGNETSGEYFHHYLPGDFHKVEIYDEWA